MADSGQGDVELKEHHLAEAEVPGSMDTLTDQSDSESK